MCALSRVSFSVAALAIFAAMGLVSHAAWPARALVAIGAWAIVFASSADDLHARCDCEDDCGPGAGLLIVVLAFAAIVVQAFLDLLVTSLGDFLVVVGSGVLGHTSHAHPLPTARARYHR